MSEPYYAGIDIGGTKCAVVIGTGRMKILDKVAFPTEPGKGPDAILDSIAQTLCSLAVRYGKEGLAGIGISCGGPLDSKRGLILSPPNLPGWNEVPISSRFEKEFGVKATLQNDANACAVAEWKFGAGRGCDNMIFLTFGTGMGAGIILDGRLYSGTNDLAGEVGHIRLSDDGPVAYGKAGSFEGYCSGAGIAQLAQKLVREKLHSGIPVEFCKTEPEIMQLSAKNVGDAAEQGDPAAIEILTLSGTYLGRGLSILIDVLNPQRIVIGSIFGRCEKFLRPAAQAVIEQECLPLTSKVCELVPAGLGEQIGDYAALSLAVFT